MGVAWCADGEGTRASRMSSDEKTYGIATVLGSGDVSARGDGDGDGGVDLHCANDDINDGVGDGVGDDMGN